MLELNSALAGQDPSPATHARRYHSPMPSADEVRKWIEWDRANPSPLGEYLVVTEIGDLDLPWAEAASEHFYKESAERERTLDAFARELVLDPADVNARFVALHFYHLARDAAELDAREEELAEVRARYLRELGLLVRLLKVEECPGVWGFIEWEILNSCLVGDLDRILRLLTRAESKKLLDRALAQIFRGQYRFVAALEGTAELESQSWRPRLYKFPGKQGHKDLVMGLRLLLLGMATRDSNSATNPSQVETLRDAAHDLEKAVSATADVPPGYNAALARSYFGIGKFRDAATAYERLLRVELKLSEKLDLRRLIYESLVLSYETAEDSGAAKDALLREIQEYPKERDLRLRMAQLESREARHDEAAEWVRRELEIAPEADADWRLSTVLALAETKRSLETLKRAVPQLCEGIQCGLERFWLPFQKLHPKAAEACVEGEVNAALSRHLEIFPRKYARDAAKDWAVAVEVQLRETLFIDFRGVVGRNDGLRTIAEKGAVKGCKTEIFANFLLGKSRLALGQMHRVLYECNSARPGEEIHYELRQWLRNEHPRLDVREAARVLQGINDFRNPVTHREGKEGDPEGAIRLCRNFLETITSTY